MVTMFIYFLMNLKKIIWTCLLQVKSKTFIRIETIEVISTDKATVAIQVNPQADQDSTIFVDGQKATSHNTAFKVFFKAQPKALGVMYLMMN